jgi:hypothetical protein
MQCSTDGDVQRAENFPGLGRVRVAHRRIQKRHACAADERAALCRICNQLFPVWVGSGLLIGISRKAMHVPTMSAPRYAEFTGELFLSGLGPGLRASKHRAPRRATFDATFTMSNSTRLRDSPSLELLSTRFALRRAGRRIGIEHTTIRASCLSAASSEFGSMQSKISRRREFGR